MVASRAVGRSIKADRALLEPMLIPFVGLEVIQNHVKLAIRKSRDDSVHEA
jgi:hypothetical protein